MNATLSPWFSATTVRVVLVLAHLHGLGDRHSCHWQAVQTGEVGELLLRRIDGVASLAQSRTIRFWSTTSRNCH